MAASGIEPDFLTVGSMISAYADANQPRRAAAIMQDFLDSGGQVNCKAALYGLIPGICTHRPAVWHIPTRACSQMHGMPGRCCRQSALQPPHLLLHMCALWCQRFACSGANF